MTRLIQWTSVCSFTFAAIMAGSALLVNVAPVFAQTVVQCSSCGDNCCITIGMPCLDDVQGCPIGCGDCECKRVNTAKLCMD